MHIYVLFKRNSSRAVLFVFKNKCNIYINKGLIYLNKPT